MEYVWTVLKIEIRPIYIIFGAIEAHSSVKEEQQNNQRKPVEGGGGRGRVPLTPNIQLGRTPGVDGRSEKR